MSEAGAEVFARLLAACGGLLPGDARLVSATFDAGGDVPAAGAEPVAEVTRRTRTLAFCEARLGPAANLGGAGAAWVLSAVFALG
jgi:hypothetical protein